MTTYYPEYKPHNAEQFAELEHEFMAASNVTSLKRAVVHYTLGTDFSREDIMVALGRVERAKGWTI